LARTYTHLLLCDGDEDEYRATVAVDEGLLATLRHDPALGDLSLAAVVAGEVVGRSDHPYGVEVVGVAGRLERQDVLLRVLGHPGASVPYTLTLERVGGDECLPDGLEGVLGNEDAAHARRIGEGEHRLTLCPGDEDWLAVELAAGSRLTVRADPEGPIPVVTLRLLDAGGGVLAEGQEAGGALVAETDAADSGWRLVHLSGAGPQVRTRVDLTVEVAAAPDAAALACAAPVPLLADVPLSLRAGNPVDRLAGSCDPEQTADHVASFVLERAANVDLMAFGAVGLSLRRTCADPGSEIACTAALDPGLYNLVLDTGEWFVVVEVPGAAPAELVLLALLNCENDGHCPGDQVCQGAICTEPCASDDDCDGAQTCNEQTGHCEEPVACAGDDDCAGFRVCGPDGSCFLPECAENADCEAACVDRLCADGPPVACGPDDPCPAPQQCAPLGACTTDGPCADDDDCPAGAPRCHPIDGRCLGCLTRADCEPAEHCFDGGCTYLFMEACAGDDDCPGSRTCDAFGVCGPGAGCEGDWFDALPEAFPVMARTYTGLVLCDGDQDAYRAFVPAGEELQVVMRYAPEDGDLALAVRDVAEDLDLGSSDGRLGVEVVGVYGQPVEQDLEILVWGHPGDSVPYSLTVERLEPDDCLPDRHEGLLGNDDATHAVPLPLDQTHLGLCPGDEDWFSLDLAAGSRLQVWATPRQPAPEVGMTLLVPDGGADVDAPQDANGFALDEEIEEDGRYHLRFASDQPDTRVRLDMTTQVEALADAETHACAAPHALAEGQPVLLPTPLPVGRFTMSCGEAGGADHVARFDLAAPAEVSLQVDGEAFGVVMALRRVCDDPGSEEACVDAADGLWERVPLEAGVWFAIVGTRGGVQPELTLTVH